MAPAQRSRRQRNIVKEARDRPPRRPRRPSTGCPVWRSINLSALHSLVPQRRAPFAAFLVPALALLLGAAQAAPGQTAPNQTAPTQTPADGQSSSGSQLPAADQGAGTPTSNGGTTHSRVITDAQGTKLALAAPANYKNKYEVYGGVGLENFQAGQTLPRRMNLATLEGQATYWMRPRLGITGDYRFAGGTTPVFANRYYNRPAVLEHNFLGGVTFRGPKGRYAAIDYHAFAGGSYGIFDHTTKQTPDTGLSATDIGLYSNRFAFKSALGGSVDFNYTRNIAVRIQPDLILEHYGTELREFFAISGGIMYRFGKR